MVWSWGTWFSLRYNNLVIFGCKILPKSFVLNKISTLTFENFFCHYNIKILRRVKIPKQNIEWENCFYIVKFRENVQITHIGSIYKNQEKYFIPKKIAGKG